MNDLTEVVVCNVYHPNDREGPSLTAICLDCYNATMPGWEKDVLVRVTDEDVDAAMPDSDVSICSECGQRDSVLQAEYDLRLMWDK